MIPYKQDSFPHFNQFNLFDVISFKDIVENQKTKGQKVYEI
jgi:hypothetical protein